MFNNLFPQNRAGYEIRNMEKCGTAREAAHDNTAHALSMLDMRATHTNTHTHSQYVTLIIFLRQQRSGVRASMLRLYVIVSCLSS